MEERPAVQIIISDEATFLEKKRKLLESGPSRCQIIADFDRTLTTTFISKNEYGVSSHGILENSDQLSSSYKARMRELFDYYYPIEKDMNYPHEEKVKKMVEWWEKAHEALINERVNYNIIKAACSAAAVTFRKGVSTMFDVCDKHDIPVLIFSAGLGDVIRELIKQRISGGREFKNLHIISNMVDVDENGIICGFKGQLIHVFNKNEHAVADEHVEWWSSVANRHNVILLGDSPGDVTMADGVPNPNVILRIGFLNEQVEQKLDSYKKMFDVVITNDGPMDFVLDLLMEILNCTTPK